MASYKTWKEWAKIFGDDPNETHLDLSYITNETLITQNDYKCRTYFTIKQLEKFNPENMKSHVIRL